MGEYLDVDTLRDAYRHGIFPWPHDDLPLPWFCPRRRTVIFFNELHVGRSLRRSARQTKFHFTIDAAFERVIAGCASTPRPDEQGTWINPRIIEAYVALLAGFAMPGAAGRRASSTLVADTRSRAIRLGAP